MRLDDVVAATPRVMAGVEEHEEAVDLVVLDRACMPAMGSTLSATTNASDGGRRASTAKCVHGVP